MKNKNIITILLIGSFLAGCSPSGEKDTSQSKTIDQKITKTQDALKDAAVDLSAYTYEQKNEFVIVMKKQIDELETNIKEISASIEKSTAAVKAEAKPKLVTLREQAAQLARQMSAIETSTQSTWEGIKADSHEAYLASKDSITQMRQWISETITPENP